MWYMLVIICTATLGCAEIVNEQHKTFTTKQECDQRIEEVTDRYAASLDEEKINAVIKYGCFKKNVT